MARRQRWADMADSSSSNAAPAPPAARGGPPFWLILRVYLAGLFRPNVAWSSVARLQRLLRRDPRAAQLPAGWRDLVFHLTFQRRAIRRQVRHFVRAALAQEWSTTVLRAWQPWLRLQTFYDPPTWNSWAYHLIMVHQFGPSDDEIQLGSKESRPGTGMGCRPTRRWHKPAMPRIPHQSLLAGC